MSQDSNDFEMPARKLRVADMSSLIYEDDGSWRYSGGSGGSFDASMVWLQGVVDDISEDMTEIVLRDGEASATLTISDSVPGGAGEISSGSYIMAVGTVDSAGRGCPRIVAVLRLSDLSSNPAHKLSWPQEVFELKQILLEQSRIVR